MKFKGSLLTLLCVFLFSTLFAQDKIFKKNGEVIDAKVKSVTPEMITFKKFDNPDGPDYSIPKQDVVKIKYQNGSEDIFEENNDRIGVTSSNINNRTKTAINNNIVSFAPIEFSDNGYGVGLSFERLLDKTGWVSLFVPAYLTFSSRSIKNFNTGQYDIHHSPMFYLAPGIKIYTNLNSTRKAKYSICPSLVFATGSGYNSENGDVAEQSRTQMGAMVSFGWNYFPSNHLYMGFDLGLGATYTNSYGGQTAGTTGLSHASLRVGYRYHDRNNVPVNKF